MCLITQSLALSVDCAGGPGEAGGFYLLFTTEKLNATGSDVDFPDKGLTLVGGLSNIALTTGSEPLNPGSDATPEQIQLWEVSESTGWDLDTTWIICEGDYPTLQWQTSECGDP